MRQRLPQANAPDNTFLNDVHAFDIEAGFAAVVQLYFFAAVAWVQGCKSRTPMRRSGNNTKTN